MYTYRPFISSVGQSPNPHGISVEHSIIPKKKPKASEINMPVINDMNPVFWNTLKWSKMIDETMCVCNIWLMSEFWYDMRVVRWHIIAFTSVVDFRAWNCVLDVLFVVSYFRWFSACCKLLEDIIQNRYDGWFIYLERSIANYFFVYWFIVRTSTYKTELRIFALGVFNCNLRNIKH